MNSEKTSGKFQKESAESSEESSDAGEDSFTSKGHVYIGPKKTMESRVTKSDEPDGSSEIRDDQAPFSDKGNLEKLSEQTTSNVKGTSSKDKVFSIVGQEKNFSKSSSDSKDNQEDEVPPRESLKRRGALVPRVIEEPSIDGDDSSPDPASDSCCCLHF